MDHFDSRSRYEKESWQRHFVLEHGYGALRKDRHKTIRRCHSVELRARPADHQVLHIQHVEAAIAGSEYLLCQEHDSVRAILSEISSEGPRPFSRQVITVGRFEPVDYSRIMWNW